jgi:hypothetical protein
MKKIVIFVIIGILLLTSSASSLAEINTSTTINENSQDDTYEDFNCFIIGRVKGIKLFKYDYDHWILNGLPIVFTINSKIGFGWFVKHNLHQREYEIPADGWLRIKGSNGSYFWNKDSFKGTLETIYRDEHLWEYYFYIGVKGFIGFKFHCSLISGTFIIGYAKHVKLGPYSPW